jgi:methionyl-tRNA formyltransferase
MSRRFAIACVDRYLGVFEAFVRNGWEPVKLFTVPARSELGNQQAAIAFAEKNKMAIQLSPMTERDMAELRGQQCDTLIMASYDWKIPDWQPFLKHAVNFHPSPLPEGRGPYPPVRAILEKRAHWGVTCYRLTPEIDKGDILAMEKFPLQPDECHESIDLKIQMAAKKLALFVAQRFPNLWENAKPQEGGSYWRKYKLADRIVDFMNPIEDILLHIRAFGDSESLAQVNDRWLLVKRAVGWVEEHNNIPGAVVHVFNRTIVVAAVDGYIALLESNIAPHHVILEMQAELADAANLEPRAM